MFFFVLYLCVFILLGLVVASFPRMPARHEGLGWNPRAPKHVSAVMLVVSITGNGG